MVGFWTSVTREKPMGPDSCEPGLAMRPAPPFRSAPAQKATPPAPVRMSASSESSALNAWTASNSSWATSALTALRASGRLIVTTRARSRRSVRTTGMAMSATGYHNERVSGVYYRRTPQRRYAMAKQGDVIENPVTGERIVFRQTSAGTNGELLQFELTLKPHGFVPVEHVHSRQEERVEVVSGSVRYRLGGKEESLSAGQAAVLPPSIPHTLWNDTDDEAHLIMEMRPPLGVEAALGVLLR